MTGHPNEFTVDGDTFNSSETELDPHINVHGDWFFDESLNKSTFLGNFDLHI